jgi:Ion channel
MEPRENPWRHLVLLISLLLLFIVSPFAAALRFGVVVLNVFGAVVLLSGTYAVSKRKHLFVITLILTIVSVITGSAMFIWPGKWIGLTTQASILVTLALFSVSILMHVLRSGRITADKIYAAICVYLLIGYAWAFADAILEGLNPGSFSISPNATSVNEHIERTMQLRCFSFMTLTTVGYGDIVARSPMARTFAVLEALMGQLYLAVLIARLVGLHIVHGMDSNSRDND